MTSPATKTLRTPAALAGAGLIAADEIAPLEAVAARYAVAITPYLAQQIAEGGPGLARQYLPAVAELNGEGALNPTELAAAFAYVAEHQEIWEVIVTGGDPLVLSPRRLAELMAGLGAIDHVKVVRFHTRLPVVDPDAVTDELVAALSAPGKAVYVALHANHPDELTPQARAACAKMIDAGIAMVSQSVLLRGVNDDVAVLGALMRAFVETRIKPYYLHQGDLAPGTSHLRVPISEGQALMRSLRGDYSGLCQPTYVLDIPGGHGKSPIGLAYVEGVDGAYEVEDPQGVRHAYPPKA